MIRDEFHASIQMCVPQILFHDLAKRADTLAEQNRGKLLNVWAEEKDGFALRNYVFNSHQARTAFMVAITMLSQELLEPPEGCGDDIVMGSFSVVSNLNGLEGAQRRITQSRQSRNLVNQAVSG